MNRKWRLTVEDSQSVQIIDGNASQDQDNVEVSLCARDLLTHF